MIRLYGAQGTPEYDAAVALGGMIAKAWPIVEADTNFDVRIVAGAKCHGQRVRDIDILLLAEFGAGLSYTPFLPSFHSDGQPFRPEQVQVDSLCIAIEVKEHTPSGIRFIGTSVEVKYKGRWHNATEQNEKQLYSVKAYLEYHGIRSPWVVSLLWLRNIPNTSLPARPHSILGAQTTWELILNIVGQLMPLRRKDESWVLTAGSEDGGLARTVDLFTKIIEPTPLDRKRMERLMRRDADIAAIKKEVGNKLTLLRGRGGTGKTVRLLQLAHSLYDELGARVLILTYNKALVADIRRLLTLSGIGDDRTERSVQIQTVHSYLHAVFQGLGILDHNYQSFLQDYEQLKREALAFLQAGVVGSTDFEDLVRSDTEAFRWDFVFVDEGQDWPVNERDLLVKLYGHQRLVVADGIDQFVRNHVPADWRGDLKLRELHTVRLRRCLRMKAGLARFVTAFAQALGLPYTDWEPNDEIPGGKVIVVEGSYFTHRQLHEELLASNTDAGNQPVDMLFCVPPGTVRTEPGEANSRSLAARAFNAWEHPTWDGASEDVREGYPTDVKQLRIVQYDSCRGLEGWIVVNLGLDQLYEFKYRLAPSLAHGQEVSSSQEGTEETSQAHIYAARWVMIPLTRAIDTLVIQIDGASSRVREALEIATNEHPDYVEWLTGE